MRTAPGSLGAGLSYRAELHRDIARHVREIDFLEIVAEDFLGEAPEAMERVSALRGGKPVAAHGRGLSLGAAEPPRPGYVECVSRLVCSFDCVWYSEHLAFSRGGVGRPLPLWLTEEGLEAVRGNVRRVKEQLRVPLLLENVASYYPIPDGEMSEADFLARAALDTDCGLLLDLNNLHISSFNLGFDPYAFLSEIPLDRVVQVHIAGGRPLSGILVDTHASGVHEEVWRLLAYAVRHCPVRGVTLEWDHDFPPFSVLREHLLHARHVLRRFGAGKRGV